MGEESKKMRLAVLTLLSVKHPALKPEPSSDEEKELNHNILSNIFGNIGIIGTSAKISNYPESIRCYDLSAGRLNPNLLKGEDIKLGEILVTMIVVSKAADGPPMGGATLRQMCEPFANEAYHYLKAAANSGVYTNLAKKMTRAGNKEPQVMFDFSKGLAISRLTRSEASVMQVMHQRVFRTEGAKGVFEAQSNVAEGPVEV
uniref:Coat protein n=1 Tax=Grapevine virus G TaxID=2022475 RepID=A0A291EU02_9VIRU|nr:coat protein [Grapevine virus G]